MGDRGNIVIKASMGGKLYFYTHWGGSKLPQVLQEALKRGRDRWGDEPYLARIIFCEMVRGSEMETTGFGISTYETDNEHPLLIVDIANGTVNCRGDSWSFHDFTEMGDNPIPDF